MASDPKMSAPPESPSSVKHRDKGIRIFTYPKVIFIFPTLIAALICGLGMALIRDEVALRMEAAGEICLWRDARVATTLWFIYLRSRENDPVVRALLEVIADLWRPDLGTANLAAELAHAPELSKAVG